MMPRKQQKQRRRIRVPKMYTDFASVYDRLMADVDYDAWAVHYRDLLSRRGVMDGAVVLEPACGTGNLSVRLARRYSLQPSDASVEMLSKAAEKARDAGLLLPFVHQDMRRLRTHRPADAIVCACDGVNYLLTPSALSAFFSSAREALKPGGVLAFDVSSVDKLSRILGSRPQLYRADDICYLWENAWDAHSNRLQLSLSIFVQRADGAYERIDEEQVQRGWTEGELRAALSQAGFGSICCYGNFTVSPPQPNAQRLHLTALKEE